jgi:signal transduction histidine kinase/ligand-binding sensor domain-containing protein
MPGGDGSRAASGEGGAAADRDTDYLIDTWQTDQGLPQGTVTSIAQGPDGYLWLGTFNGIARFDGVQFRSLSPANTPGLTSARIVRVKSDGFGALWAAAEEGPVFRVVDGRATEHRPPTQGSTAQLAHELGEDRSGHLWVLTYESTIFRFDGGGFAPASPKTSDDEDGFDSMAVDTGGVPWAATRHTVCRWREDTPEERWPTRGVSSEEIRELTRARDGGVWAACADAGQLWLRRFTEEGLAMELGPYPWGGRPVNSLVEDHLGRVWIGFLGGGILRCDPRGGVLEIGLEQGLPNLFVRCLFEDREGNVWAGLQGGGLCRLKPALFQKYTHQEGLSGDQVLSVAEGDDGDLWVGTNGDWLNRIHGNEVDRYGEESGLSNGSVWSVLHDRSDNLWVGTWGGGLFRLGEAKFVPFLVPGFPSVLMRGSPLSHVVLALFEDSQGGIWLGQHSYGTVTRIVDGVPTLLNVPDAPSNFDIRVISEDASGAMWFGTHGAGLYRYQQGTFTRYGKESGLRSEFIWALDADPDGTLWIGTYLGGLSCWREGRFATLTTQQGLPNDVVCQILDDQHGNLWCGSYGGVFQVSKREFLQCLRGEIATIQPRVYGKADGLPGIECTGGFQPSACRLRDGRLCFPTLKGLAIVDPSKIAPDPKPPEVLIEAVALDGRKVWDSLELRSRTAVGTPPVIEVPPGEPRVEIQYTGLNFTAPEKVMFRSRLTGWDRDWVEAGGRRRLDYSHLPPGDYRLEIAARNGGSPWSEGEAGIALRVLPEFWQTQWFRTVAALGIAALIATLVGLVQGRRHARRMAVIERQSAIEHERLRIAQDIHDDLGARLTEITLLSELVKADTTEGSPVERDLQSISQKARELTRSVDEIVWAVDPSNDNLESLVTYGCGYAEDYLHLAQMRCRFDLPASIPRHPVVAERRHELFMAFKESLTNVVRHSGATEVVIRFAAGEGGFCWSVSDNGRGLTPPKPGGGQHSGLENMRRRLERIHGRCEITSTPGGGVRVELHFSPARMAQEGRS